MKHLLTLFIGVVLTTVAVAQVPNNISFQGIARDTEGMPISNTEMSIAIDLIDNAGSVEYSEEHTLTSDIAGLYSFGIGSGEVLSGDFNSIDWGTTKSASVRMDVSNDGTIDIEFTSPLNSVPYALYAKDVENKDDADADPNNEMQALTITGNQIFLSGGGSIILPTDNVNDADADAQNELQQLTLASNLLSISSGNTVDLSQFQVIVGNDPSDVPTSPQAGQLYYDEVCNSLFIYNLGTWSEVPLNAGVTDIYDKDGDGIPNATDNCINTFNPNQEDADNDGIGDACEGNGGVTDTDGDGVENANDNCPTDSNANQADADNDGLGDVCDSDRDGDGIANTTDNCPDDFNPNQEDLDSDGIGSTCDSDEPTNTGLHPAFADFDTDSYTIFLDGDNVVIETNGLPDHTSPYWSNTTERCLNGPMGTRCTNEDVTEDHPLFVAPTATNFDVMAPGNIDDFNGSYTLTVPVSPQLASSSTATGLGAIGMAVSGSVIYNDEEGPNVPLDAAVGSLDYTAAHTGPQSYHYHLEPKAWSDDDDKLIGIMADGFFLYGRRDYNGAYPTDLDESGGHFGPTIHNPAGEYHYHIMNDLFLNEYYILFPGDYQGTPNNIR